MCLYAMGGILKTLLAAFAFLPIATTAHAQWEIEDSHTTASLRGITNVGGGVAWASGTDGTVLRTLDDGKTWQTCSIPLAGTRDTAEKLDFRGIQAFDENTAIVMSSGPGDQSRLYKTTDGCQTWKLILTNLDKDGFWDALRFDERKPELATADYRSRMHGALVGDPVDGNFVIFETTNGGDTWWRWPNSKKAKPAKALPKEAIFAASNSSLILPGFNERFAFVTGGASGSRVFLAQHADVFDNGGWSYFGSIQLAFPSSESAGAFSIAARYSKGPLEPDVMLLSEVTIRTPTLPWQTVSSFRWAKCLTQYEVNSAIQNPTPRLPLRRSLRRHHENLDHRRPQRHRHLHRRRPQLASAHALVARRKDADKNWNALSLPFVVGPHGRIGKLRANALPTVPAKTK